MVSVPQRIRDHFGVRPEVKANIDKMMAYLPKEYRDRHT
jgi:hypothetical protein